MEVLGIKYGTVSSIAIIALLYMPGPAISAIIVQKFIFKEQLQLIGLTLKNISLRDLLFVPVIYLAFIVITLFIIFIAGNLLHIHGFGEISFASEDVSHNIQLLVNRLGKTVPAIKIQHAEILLVVSVLSGIFSGASINMIFALGEELGWRGLLLTELKGTGFIKSNFVIGTIWGAWHFPIILMGHNYPNYPYLGCLMMLLFCISLSFVFSMITMRSKTVFAAAALHGMINAGAPVTLLCVTGGNELIGSIVGLSGVLAALITSTLYYIPGKRIATL
jgi:membrane protease YdiL (CAAX protease family)